MSYRVLCLTAFLGAFLSSIAFADDSTDRAKLTGSWQGESGGVKAVWIVESQGEVLHITNSQGDKKIAEFACNLGKECEAKDAGHKVKATLYFNGPKLVVLETKGEEVVKKRFGVTEAGDMLEIEVIPVGAGKAETLHFTRVQNVAAVATSAK
jgi:hypothetical protein